MEKIVESGLPGFVLDNSGRYGIMLGGAYLCCFVNSIDGGYDVTVDILDTNSGDFTCNLEWESFGNDAAAAICCLRNMVKKYCPPVFVNGGRKWPATK